RERRLGQDPSARAGAADDVVLVLAPRASRRGVAEGARRDRARRSGEPPARPGTAPPHVRTARPRARRGGALAAYGAADDLPVRHDPRRNRLLRARPRAPRLLWMRNRLPVLRRSGLRPRRRGARSRRGSPLPPPMNDLRARIAAIVERDRARTTQGERGSEVGPDRNPLYAAAPQPPGAGG